MRTVHQFTLFKDEQIVYIVKNDGRDGCTGEIIDSGAECAQHGSSCPSIERYL